LINIAFLLLGVDLGVIGVIVVNGIVVVRSAWDRSRFDEITEEVLMVGVYTKTSSSSAFLVAYVI